MISIYIIVKVDKWFNVLSLIINYLSWKILEGLRAISAYEYDVIKSWSFDWSMMTAYSYVDFRLVDELRNVCVIDACQICVTHFHLIGWKWRHYDVERVIMSRDLSLTRGKWPNCFPLPKIFAIECSRKIWNSILIGRHIFWYIFMTSSPEVIKGLGRGN